MDSPRSPASFFTQANALLRKNLCIQAPLRFSPSPVRFLCDSFLDLLFCMCPPRACEYACTVPGDSTGGSGGESAVNLKRNLKTNIGITVFPILICVLLVVLQNVINNELNNPKYKCGCACVETDIDGTCKKTECGIEHSTLEQVWSCAIPSPPRWPALIQVPQAEFRAVKTASQPFDDLPDPSCRDSRSCPATVLITGKDRAFAESVSGGLFPAFSPTLNVTDYLDALSRIVAGSDTAPWYTQLVEPAFSSGDSLYLVQPQCLPYLSQTISYYARGIPLELNIQCIEGVLLWRESTSVINDELLKGYIQRGKTNEFIAGYDFLNTTEHGLGINVWYNSTYNGKTAYSFIAALRVPRLVNALSNTYLKFIRGSGVEMLLEYVKEMPKVGTSFRFDLSSLLSALFFTWIVELLFPVMLTYLVYEKQQKLKIMMKMHGLKDGPYWMISYAYFFVLSVVYMTFFVIFGSLIGLNFFRVNNYGIQFVFFFIYINLQIAFALFVASFFSSVKIATVLGYIYVFGSGLLGAFLFRFFIEDRTFPHGWILVMEIVPGFSLYRGLYELGQYAFSGSAMGATGMMWENLKDPINGMCDILIIMTVEWVLLLVLAFYLDRVSSVGGAVRKIPLLFFRCSQNKHAPSLQKPSFAQQDSKVIIEMEKPDVAQERQVVEKLLMDRNANQAIICDNLRKVYPGRDGNPDKLAVQGLSLALPKGQCFGMLGPNGAGKTSFISMMIGLIKPTSGTAYVHGIDINMDMDAIYTNMGVCPQHKYLLQLLIWPRVLFLRSRLCCPGNWCCLKCSLLWETLTGKEHLFFYGRLKNLKGAALMKTVEDSLKSVNLFHGGVGDKQVGKYSGGMKRRLSVAVSLIGDPKLVFMDEPSTGLDPASRNNLWNIVKEAKRNCAIVLTTHSMEEAEVLCDRLGIFVDGDFQCLGNPKELKARYGGAYIFTMTTSPEQEQEVEQLVHRLSPSANKIYNLSGTQKFELPKQDVRIADVFHAVEIAKSRFSIHAWGLVDTTLEDVFIKVAKGTQVFNDVA